MKLITITLGLLFTIGASFAQKKLLVVTETVAFDHGTKAAAKTMVTALATANGFIAEVIDKSDGYFTDAKLAEYAAVYFSNNSGNVLNATELASFKKFIQAGGGFIGNHLTSDMKNDTWTKLLVGATFAYHHPDQFVNEAIVNNKSHVSTSSLGDTWRFYEEWYYWATDNDAGKNPNLVCLMNLDQNAAIYTQNMSHPVTWYQYYDGGRSFFTGLGHNSWVYGDSNFRKMMLGAFQWAMKISNPTGPELNVFPSYSAITFKQGYETPINPISVLITNVFPAGGTLANVKATTSADWFTLSFKTNTGNNQELIYTLNDNAKNLAPGFHKEFITVTADNGQTMRVTVSLQVTAATLDIAKNKTVVSSSNEGTFVAKNATDGNPGTRWGSAKADGESIYVDLGAVYDVQSVVINWDASYPTSYQILLSNDAQEWNPVYTDTQMKAGETSVNVKGYGRYVKIVGTKRIVGSGISMWGFEVYGTVKTGIEENSIVNSVVIYPNPLVNNQLNVLLNDNLQTSSITITSIDGRIISNYLVDKNTDGLQINFSDDLSKGVYVLTVKGDKSSFSKLIIKE